MARGFLIFHLNLAFSAIEAAARSDVIRKCYWPLLMLAESTGIPVGIELTGWTLRQISLIDQTWIVRFREMLKEQQCELIGSGWSQIIGPLVPYEVNRWNQKLGVEAYTQILGDSPRIALVNEMAFSTSMVDVYAGAGYEGIVMDRDNVRLALGLDHNALATTPTHALGYGDCSLPVLWSDSILFQRLQRVVHGDIPLSEYMAYVLKRLDNDNGVLPIYCNDAEIFDYRPGRFSTETCIHPEGEWERLKRICKHLQQDSALKWLRPSEALAVNTASATPNRQRLTTISQPIPVKKQAKYNINRWAVTGKDDLWLNTTCHRIHQAISGKTYANKGIWRELCELWSSDLRTHITLERWNKAVARISKVTTRLGLESPQVERSSGAHHQHPNDLTSLKNAHIIQDDDGILFTVNTDTVHLILNARRGLAIKSLAFRSHHYKPVIGTLPQGYFSNIELAADFYSGGVLIEVPGESCRGTDLEWVTPNIRQEGSLLLISADIPLAQGTLKKTITVDVKTEQVLLKYDFQQFKRPLGTVRVGIITLLPEFFSLPMTARCFNGGRNAELFQIDQKVNHGQAASAFVSSTASFGATNGSLFMEDTTSTRMLVFTWNPAVCAAIPMLQHQSVQDLHLTRLSFSLCELDDTSQMGGRLIPFTVRLSPA